MIIIWISNYIFHHADAMYCAMPITMPVHLYYCLTIVKSRVSADCRHSSTFPSLSYYDGNQGCSNDPANHHSNTFFLQKYIFLNDFLRLSIAFDFHTQ